jgi:hypothetical protein
MAGGQAGKYLQLERVAGAESVVGLEEALVGRRGRGLGRSPGSGCRRKRWLIREALKIACCYRNPSEQLAWRSDAAAPRRRAALDPPRGSDSV